MARIHCYIRFEESLLEKISQTSPGELDSPTEKAAFCLGCKEHKPGKRLGVKGDINTAHSHKHFKYASF